MDTNALQKFAEDLKKQRSEKNVTLEQIASKTRIDIKFLSAIENADFDVLPEVYIKAFIKEYAKFIDLPYDTVLKKFELARQGIIEDDAPVENQNETPENEFTVRKEFDSSTEVYNSPEFSEKNSKNNFVLLISAAVFVILLIVLFTVFGGSEEKIVTEKSMRNTPKISSEVTSPVNEKALIKEPVIPDDYLKLKIFATDTTWIKIIKDESVAEEALMLPNSSKNVEAGKSFYLVVGNAAGVNFELNSKKLSFKGDKNQIRSIYIDSNGLKYILTKEIPGYNEEERN